LDFYSIASGSSGNCIYVGTDRASVLIDAGISCKKITEALHGIDRSIRDLTGILVTHEHSDHIAGLGVLSRKAHIPVYATQATIRQILRYAPLGKVDEDLFHPIDADRPFFIGDMRIEAFHISHDAADPVAYRVESGNQAAAVATDMGCYNRYTLNHLRNLDVVLLEANHDENMLQAGPYPYPLKRRILSDKGHLSNEACSAELSELVKGGTLRLMLGHLSEQNNTPEVALRTAVAELERAGLKYKVDYTLDIAPAEATLKSVIF
jgi:phosphoribosyl 1,2-cyclic phosphodiesterase